MLCQDCQRKCRKHGVNRNGTQRFRCPACKKTYSEERESLFGAMRVPEDKALLALNLLCEGSSVRAVSRVTGLPPPPAARRQSATQSWPTTPPEAHATCCIRFA